MRPTFMKISAESRWPDSGGVFKVGDANDDACHNKWAYSPSYSILIAHHDYAFIVVEHKHRAIAMGTS